MNTQESHFQDILTPVPFSQEHRNEALQRFRNLGFPTRKLEDWKYTSISALRDQAYNTPSGLPVSTGTKTDIDFLGPKASVIVLRNGFFDPGLSRISSEFEIKVVLPSDLPSTKTMRPHELREKTSVSEIPILRDLDVPNLDAMSSLNMGSFPQATVLRIPKDTKLSDPIYVLHLTDDLNDQTSIFPRLQVQAGPNSCVEILEHFLRTSEGVSLWTTAVTDFWCEESSIVTYVRLQEDSQSDFHLGYVYANLESSSHFSSLAVNLGSKLTRQSIQVQVVGELAQTHLNGIYVLNGHQHADHHTKIVHSKPRGVSRQLYKGILAGNARSVFCGKIRIEPEAQQTDSQQLNKNLLLSSKARSDSKPELEIFADDVKARHGATIGQIQREELFYLESRGIDRSSAMTLLSSAFVNEVVDRVGSSPLQSAILGRVTQKLSTLDWNSTAWK